jgi:hypothetical protein
MRFDFDHKCACSSQHPLSHTFNDRGCIQDHVQQSIIEYYLNYKVCVMEKDVGGPGSSAVCAFITTVPITKLFEWGEGDSGGQVLLETTSQGLCVCLLLQYLL